MAIPSEKLGPPGTLMYLHVVPVFKDSPLSDRERLADKLPRKFTVIARLAKSHEALNDVAINFEEKSGDSLFSAPAGTTYLKAESHDATFFIYPNTEGRLSTVRLECIACSSEHARQQFNTIVEPSLDKFSYDSNTPLHVVQISITDQKHHISSTEIVSPHPLVVLNNGLTKVSITLAPVYAMYREAINASSPFYKFFCLYKILEGLLRTLKSKLYSEARTRGVTLPPLHARVPSYPDMPPEQALYAGKSITKFFDEFLTEKFRNSMAHFMSDEGAVLNVNEMAGIHRYWSVIHVTTLCTREVIAHFEQCLVAMEL